MTWKLSNFSNGSEIWFKSCGMTCEITITNVMKVKNHFNHFWNIFAFFNTSWHVFFSCKHTPSHHNIKRKWCFSIFSRGYALPQYVKTLWKSFVVLMWFRLKSDHPKKQYNVTSQRGVTIVHFHPFLTKGIYPSRSPFFLVTPICNLTCLNWSPTYLWRGIVVVN
jgi:hypothetical protein